MNIMADMTDMTQSTQTSSNPFGYDLHKSYQYNYEHPPVTHAPLKLPLKNPLNLWGHPLNSPIGIPAGSLLNAAYIEYYAKMGFDILVYKTVRTQPRTVHPFPNCLIVKQDEMLQPKDIQQSIHTDPFKTNWHATCSITNSFGIPSKPIEIWQADVAKAKKSLANGQMLIVSCAGTPSQDIHIAEDYAKCAVLAMEAGADAIELIYSCPNVQSKEGSIFQDAELSRLISKTTQKAIGSNIPLMIKMGLISEEAKLLDVVKANAPYIDGISTINTIPMKVLDHHTNQQALPGEGRLISGICGYSIRNLALNMVQRLAKIKQSHRFDFILCGVGGIMKPNDFDLFFEQGAEIAMSCTGSIANPNLAQHWKI